MKNNLKPIRVLAIESSCDETSAAIISCANINHQETISQLADKQFSNSNSQISKLPTANGQLPTILSNIISSQVDLHAKTGGVVPEVASRAHIESIIPVISEALIKANPNFKTSFDSELEGSSLRVEDLNFKQIQKSKSKIQNSLEIENLDLNIVPHFDGIPPEAVISDLGFSNSDLLKNITHIAVTVGPGLIGSLLVGFNTAKSLAYALDIPIVPINHIEGHIYSALGGEISRYKLQGIPQRATLRANKSQISNLENSKNQGQSVDKISGGGLNINFPILALTVSGGHTSLTMIRDHGVYENVGSTLDDAAGEAFDKVAKLLGLGYPGGPALSKIAEQFRKRNSNYQKPITKQNTNSNSKSQKGVIASHRPAGEARQSIMGSDCFVPRNYKGSSISLPLPLKNDPSFNFSYSGLKTAVLMLLRKAEKEYQNDPEELEGYKQELACVFEETAVAHLIDKTLKAAKKYQPKTILLAGGVSANSWLRQELSKAINNLAIEQNDVIASPFDELSAKQSKNNEATASGGPRLSWLGKMHEVPQNAVTIEQSSNIRLLMPSQEMTGDNAAMIGLAAYYHILRGDVSTWNETKVDSNIKL